MYKYSYTMHPQPKGEFLHLISTGYFRVIAGFQGFSTVSTSVNNTTVLKEKSSP